MRVKKESEKAGLELNMKKTKMIWPLAPSLHADRWGKSGNSDRFYLFGLQNYCSDCSHEIKRCLLLGRKAMTNLDTILKSRGITLLTKVHLVKAMVFPIVMYRCESRTIKKACAR